MILHSDKKFIYKTIENTRLKLAAKRLNHDVYLEMGYIKQSYPNRIIPYKNDDIATYIVALKNDFLCGTIHISPINSPSLVFENWKDKLYSKSQKILKIISKERKAELGGLAVKKKYRGKGVAAGLYKACWLFALLNDIKWYLIKMDKKALKSLENLGWHVERIGPPLYYMGSITIPGIIQISKQLLNVYKKNINYYKYLVY